MEEKIINDKKIDLSASTLKIIAILAMVLDHSVAVFTDRSSVFEVLLRVPGRIVMPIMCYFIAEGFFYTRNKPKFFIRLFIFACISHIPYILCFDGTFFNMTSVMWSLCLGYLALWVAKSDNIKLYLKITIICLCCIMAVPANWNYIGVLWILSFGLLRGNFKAQMTIMVCIGYFFNFLPYIQDLAYRNFYQAGIILAIPLLYLYNGRRGCGGKVMKWGFYMFYPIHLLAIYLLNKFIF